MLTNWNCFLLLSCVSNISWSLHLFLQPLVCMKVGLYIHKNDNASDYSSGKRFRFAVVDLDRAENYPVNFLCMLPTQVSSKGKTLSIFVKIFGDRSLEQAKILLSKALEIEDDSEVKAEIQKRLKRLEPKPAIEAKCDGCGKLFFPRRLKRFRKNFCEECLKKKSGSRF